MIEMEGWWLIVLLIAAAIVSGVTILIVMSAFVSGSRADECARCPYVKFYKKHIDRPCDMVKEQWEEKK